MPFTDDELIAFTRTSLTLIGEMHGLTKAEATAYVDSILCGPHRPFTTDDIEESCRAVIEYYLRA